MSQPESDRSSATRRLLSALADGDATHAEAAHAFRAWRDDADARAAWHAYQLIGDVLRSEDLACEPAADESFLVALRARLADEPVVLAPQPRAAEALAARPAAAAAGGRWRGRWQGPMAMAAGFLVVLGGLGIVRPFNHAAGPALASGAQAASGSALAAAAPVDDGVVATSLQSAPQTPAQTQAAAEQLAPYLAAHRQSTMNAPFQMPVGDIRNASLVQPAR